MLIPVLVLLTGLVLFSGCSSVNPAGPGPSATPAVTAPAEIRTSSGTGQDQQQVI
jgi:hypothetical protein